jgi:XapX domain-containing protein
MRDFIIQSFASLATGLVTGVIFAWVKLPIPAPPVLPAVFGILGITLGYILFHKFFGM